MSSTVQETAHLIEELGGRAFAVKCDVSHTEDVQSAPGKTIEIFGRLDFSFNDAGVEQAITATADLTEEESDRIVDVNLRGVFLCMKDRFSGGTAEGRQRVISREPIGRMGQPEEIAAAVV